MGGAGEGPENRTINNFHLVVPIVKPHVSEKGLDDSDDAAFHTLQTQAPVSSRGS
jgi:hypothetical protein